MNLSRRILSEGLLDSEGDRCGRVDDLVVDARFDRPARVTAIVSGGGVKGQLLGRRAHQISIWLHRFLGMAPPIEPVVIPWRMVRSIGANIKLNSKTSALGLDRLNRAVAERFIGRIPGSGL
jgi:sporulation protein YlmC with PRC-barrel domain